MNYREFFEKALETKLLGFGNNLSAKCPFHTDNVSSLSVDVEKGLWNCHAGCGGGNAHQMAERLGMVLDDAAEGKEVSYDYVDESGKLLYQVVRLFPKAFRQRRRGLDGKWEWNINGIRRVPYRLPNIIKAIAEKSRIYIVEGEKDVHTLVDLGLEATTNSGGAGRWEPGFATYFKGADVVIIPDTDAVGIKHGQNIANSLSGVAQKVRIVYLSFPNGEEKGDITSWLEGGNNMESFYKIVDRLPPWTPTFIDAEAYVVGCLLKDASLAGEILNILSDIQISEKWRPILSCIRDVYISGKTVDMASVDYTGCVKFGAANWERYRILLGVAVNSAVDTINWKSYVDSVQRIAKVKYLYNKCQDAVSLINSRQFYLSEDDIGRIYTSLTESSGQREGGECVDIQTVLGDVEIETKPKRPKNLTSIDGLDRMMPGIFDAGKLTVIGARPGVGKSSLMRQMILSLSLEVRCLVFSLEELPYEVSAKMISAVARIPYVNVRERQYENRERDIGQLVKAQAEIFNSRKVLFYTGIADMGRIGVFLRAQIKGEDRPVVFIDRLGLIRRSKSARLVDALAEILEDLKRMCNELKISIILLHQLSRSGEKEGRMEPEMADLRDSGGVEENADNIIFLYNKKDDEDAYGKYIKVAKQRDGPVGKFYSGWNPKLMLFENTEVTE